MTSPDRTTSNIDKIAAIFPNVVTEALDPPAMHGATILAAVALMQELAIPEEPVALERPEPELLTWALSDSLRSTLLTELAAYRREAALHGVHRVFVPRPRGVSRSTRPITSSMLRAPISASPRRTSSATNSR